MVEKKLTKKKTAKKKTAKVVPKNKKAKTSPKKKTGHKSEQVLKLDSVLVINDARSIYIKLNELIKAKQNVLIDASKVEMVDTAILQLLVAFIKKIQLQNTEASWKKPSKEFMSRATILGLSESLGITGIPY